MSPVPDGPGGNVGDIYTIRPDGSDLRQLTSDGALGPAVLDGRRADPVRARPAPAVPRGWWTMDADGTNVAQLLSAAAIGVAPRQRRGYRSGLAAARRVGRRGPAVDSVDGDHGRTAGAHAVPDADTGPGARVQLDRVPGHAGRHGPRRHRHAACRRTRAGHRRVQHRRGPVRPVEWHVQPDGLDVGRSAPAPAATLLHDGRVLFAGGYTCGNAGPGRDVGHGRALRPDDGHVHARPAP